jgi:hypothetical protein
MRSKEVVACKEQMRNCALEVGRLTIFVSDCFPLLGNVDRIIWRLTIILFNKLDNLSLTSTLSLLSRCKTSFKQVYHSGCAETHHDMLVRPLVTHELAALIKKDMYFVAVNMTQ